MFRIARIGIGSVNPIGVGSGYIGRHLMFLVRRMGFGSCCRFPDLGVRFPILVFFVFSEAAQPRSEGRLPAPQQADDRLEHDGKWQGEGAAVQARRPRRTRLRQHRAARLRDRLLRVYASGSRADRGRDSDHEKGEFPGIVLGQRVI